MLIVVDECVRWTRRFLLLPFSPKALIVNRFSTGRSNDRDAEATITNHVKT